MQAKLEFYTIGTGGVTGEGCPFLDGLGTVGDKDNSPEKFIYRASLFQRIQLTTLLLARLPAQ